MLSKKVAICKFGTMVVICLLMFSARSYAAAMERVASPKYKHLKVLDAFYEQFVGEGQVTWLPGTYGQFLTVQLGSKVEGESWQQAVDKIFRWHSAHLGDDYMPEYIKSTKTT